MKTRTGILYASCTRFLLACLGCTLLLATAQAVSWTILITPGAGGDVVWSTTSPPKSGTLSTSGTLSFNSGSFVDLTFTAAPGYTLNAVYKNGEDWTPWLDASKHYRFGPVTKAHLIVARFSVLIPTGIVNLTFPTNNPALTAILDVTGTYTGTSPTRHHRPYSISVAMDEVGKLSGIGTVAGIVPEAGGPIIAQSAAIDTIGGKPVAHGTGHFKGTRDGVTGTCNAIGRGPVEVTTITSGGAGVTGTGSYSGRLAGIPYRERNVTLEMPASPANQANVKKAWGLNMTIVKKTDARTGKEYIAANATLQRPDSSVIVFPEKRLRYSVKYGYTVSLTRGTNISAVPAKLDRKTTVVIRRMTMAQQASVWKPTRGTVRYRFLGQKGTMNLLDFIQ